MRLAKETRLKRRILLAPSFDFSLAVDTWYVSYELNELDERLDPKFHESIVMDHVRKCHKDLTQTLKAVMLDYIPLAAWGEARWAAKYAPRYYKEISTPKEMYQEDDKQKSRQSAHDEAMSFDP